MKGKILKTVSLLISLFLLLPACGGGIEAESARRIAVATQMQSDITDPCLMAKAVKGTPVIDGEIDEIWASANVIIPQRYKQNKISPVKGEFKVLWDEKNLYVLAKVIDPVISFSKTTAWEQDSIELFVEEDNQKSPTYMNAYQIRINCNNEVTTKTYPDASALTSKSKMTDDGYLIECSIPYVWIKGEEGKKVGFDIQINDDPGGGLPRGILGWNDDRNAASANPVVFGVLELVQSDTGDAGTENNTGEKTNKTQIKINGVSIAKYIIVKPQFAASYIVMQEIKSLQKSIYEISGLQLQIVNDYGCSRREL